MHSSRKMFSKSPYFFAVHNFLLLLSLNIVLTLATDTISQGQSISGNQTIVSKGGVFELGFFTPGKSNNYYIGIWYKRSPEVIIWTANRAAPVPDLTTSKLKLTKSGNLILYNSKIRVWSSNSSSYLSSSTNINVAILLDTGNFILRDQTNSSAILWQSFDHITDTWVPHGWIGMNKVTGEYNTITSWKNTEDPAPGPFMDTIDPSGLNQFIFLWNNSKSYWTSGIWNGESFGLLPGMSAYHLYTNKFVNDDKRRYFTTTLTDERYLTRNVMHSSGQVQQWMWFDDAKGWELFWVQPVSPCDVYSVCGAYGICDQSRKPPCTCPHGFTPTSVRDWELDGWNSGCKRKTQLKCGYKNSTSGEKDGFLPIPNVHLPADSKQQLGGKGAEECELACLKNCSCTAYAYESGCSIWSGDIRNLQSLSEGDNRARTLYLRLAASDQQIHSI